MMMKVSEKTNFHGTGTLIGFDCLLLLRCCHEGGLCIYLTPSGPMKRTLKMQNNIFQL